MLSSFEGERKKKFCIFFGDLLYVSLFIRRELFFI